MSEEELTASERAVIDAHELLTRFRHDYTAFHTAFEANDPNAADGTLLAGLMDVWLARYRVPDVDTTRLADWSAFVESEECTRGEHAFPDEPSDTVHSLEGDLLVYRCLRPGCRGTHAVKP